MSKELPLVSVVIPAYNRADYIAQAIDSVLGQSYPHMEVIVVDDGSTDATPRIAAGYGARITLLRQSNSGVAAARNAGITSSTGEFVALLDSDDRWLSDKIARQIPFFADENVGLVHGAIRQFRSSDGSFIANYFPGHVVDVHDLLAFRGLCTQTLVFRRSLFDQVGGFDASFQTGEDWEWTIRAATRCAIRGTEDVVAENRIHDQQLSSDKEQLFRDSLRVLKKHASVHGHCRACRLAVAQGRRTIRSLLYRELNRRARQAAANGRLAAALGLGARALWLEPRALLRLAGRKS